MQFHLLQVARVQTALACAPPGSRLRALLWYQGETDAAHEAAARAYGANAAAMTRAVRAALHAPRLLVLQVVVTASRPLPWLQEVRSQQLCGGEDIDVQGAGGYFVVWRQWRHGTQVPRCDARGTGHSDGHCVTHRAWSCMRC